MVLFAKSKNRFKKSNEKLVFNQKAGFWSLSWIFCALTKVKERDLASIVYQRISRYFPLCFFLLRSLKEREGGLHRSGTHSPPSISCVSFSVFVFQLSRPYGKITDHTVLDCFAFAFFGLFLPLPYECYLLTDSFKIFYY